jgi:hypothetical protein
MPGRLGSGAGRGGEVNESPETCIVCGEIKRLYQGEITLLLELNGAAFVERREIKVCGNCYPCIRVTQKMCADQFLEYAKILHGGPDERVTPIHEP